MGYNHTLKENRLLIFHGTLFGLGEGGIGPLPGFLSITQKPFNHFSPNFMTLIIYIYIYIYIYLVSNT